MPDPPVDVARPAPSDPDQSAAALHDGIGGDTKQCADPNSDYEARPSTNENADRRADTRTDGDEQSEPL